MDVIDCLTTMLSSVGNNTESSLLNSCLFCYRSYSLSNTLKGCSRNTINDVVVVVLRYNKNVNRSNRIKVIKSYNVLILIEKLCRDFFVSKLTKNAIRHNLSFTRLNMQ